MTRAFRTYSPFSYVLSDCFQGSRYQRLRNNTSVYLQLLWRLRKTNKGFPSLVRSHKHAKLLFVPKKHEIAGVTHVFLDHHSYASRTLFV